MASELDSLSSELRQIRDNHQTGQSALGAQVKEDEQEVYTLRYELEAESAKFIRETAEVDEGMHAALALMIEFKEEVEGLVEVSGVRLLSTKADIEVACKAHQLGLQQRLQAL